VTPAMTSRRSLLRTGVGLLLAGLALYGAGSLGASIGSGKRASAAEYQYPGISMSATPNPTAVGQPVTITWSTTNVDSCQAYGEWSGAKPVNGSEVQLAWGWRKSVFELDCTGIWGETADGVFVRVLQPLTPHAVVDQQQTYVDDFVDQAGIAQTFTVGTAGWLGDVSINGTGKNSFDRVALTRVTQEGAPDPSRVLWSTTVVNQASGGNFHLAKPLFVLPGQRYALLLTAPGTGNDDYVYSEITCDAPHPYARGDLYVQDEPGGSWTQQEGCDTVFSTYVVQRFRSGP